MRVGRSGSLLPKNKFGTATIQHFNLNRNELVTAREAKLTAYSASLMELGPNPAEAGHGQPSRELFDFSELEFGGSWYSLVCAVAALLSPATGRRKRDFETDFARFYLEHPHGKAFRQEFIGQLFSVLSGDASAGNFPVRSSSKRAPAGELLSIRLENFKSIEQMTITLPRVKQGENDRGAALLLLGENAVGKSTVLEAIALGLSSTQSRRNLGLNPKHFALDPGLLGGESQQETRHSSVTFEFTRESRQLTATRTFKQEGSHQAPPVFAYGAFRQFVDAETQRLQVSPIATLFKPETILPNPEQWLLGLDDDEFDMVVRALREIISIDEDFDVIERDHKKKECRVVTIVEGVIENTTIKTPLRLVSSGFRSVLAMTCDIFRGLMDRNFNPDFRSLNAAKAIVLIDEIEAHLHPRWKMQIMQGLRNALPGVTFIATSHDPLCLRGMEDGEVFVMHRIGNTRAPRNAGLPVQVQLNDQLPKISQLTVEQLLTADFFGLFSTDRPEIEKEMARIADLLARRNSLDELTDLEQRAIGQFEHEIASALPVGSSETQRMVQDVVAKYLGERRQQSVDDLAALKEESKARILRILKEI
jgi:hypothetical protein